MIEPLCPFCPTNGLLRVPILYEDDTWYFAGMQEGSINNAGMAITKRHIETPFELSQDEWQKLYVLLPRFKQILDDKELAHGYNIGWNIHEAGGQNVTHAHMHILARYDDEPLAGKGIRFAFKQLDNQRPLNS